jgi:Transposase Tn5 dimerisation domain/Transposase DNA-binding/Transposase DDE domain
MTAMIAPWVMEELKSVSLNDKRLDARLCEILSAFAGQPSASIPASVGGGRAEVEATYRFFENEKPTFEDILKPHIEATRDRMAAQPIVVMAQDSSELDFTRPRAQVKGAGLLDGNSRYGAILHAMHVFTPDGTPLGTIHGESRVREETISNSSLSRSERASIPIEEKESYRWLETFRVAREEAKNCPSTRVICVADSEADIYELLAEASSAQQEIDWIVRACQDRALAKDVENPGRNGHLRERVLKEPVLFTQSIHVRGRTAKVSCETRGRRQPRESREAEVEVRAATVTLRAPWRADRKLSDVTINVVLVTEKDPPQGDVPVEWLLLTNLPIGDAEQVRQVIQFYCQRWMIEVYFRVLKAGCRVEKRLFEYIDRLLPCIAVYMIVAWRTLYVCRLGRSCPDVSCEAVFEPAEWKSVWKVVKREDPPSTPPRLDVMVRLVAQLGGYINRKRKDPPGPQTLWIGMQRMRDFAVCWELFGPIESVAAEAAADEP